MSYKLGKKIFEWATNFLQFLRVVLVFLCFFTIFYWILELAGVDFIKFAAPFFEFIKNTVHIFYNKTTLINGKELDFVFLVAVVVFLLVIWWLKFVIDFMEVLETKFEKIYEHLRKREEKIFNENLEKEYLEAEYKNDKVLFLVKFTASNLTKDSYFERNVEEGVNEKEKAVLKEFNSNIFENLRCPSEFLDNGVLLYFKDFENIDKFILQIEYTIQDLKEKYREEKWQINYTAGIDVYADTKEVEPKIQTLKNLLKLDSNNKIICLSSFKHRYLLRKYKKYDFESQGFYQIIENEEVFCIKNLK